MPLCRDFNNGCFCFGFKICRNGSKSVLFEEPFKQVLSALGKDVYGFDFCGTTVLIISSLVSVLSILFPQIMKNTKLENWENKVLKSYLDDMRIIRIPASRKKRLVVLRWLVRKFELDFIYKESQVNEIISNHHSDFATLRRELVGYQLMERENSMYWRNPASLWKSENEIMHHRI